MTATCNERLTLAENGLQTAFKRFALPASVAPFALAHHTTFYLGSLSRLFTGSAEPPDSRFWNGPFFFSFVNLYYNRLDAVRFVSRFESYPSNLSSNRIESESQVK